MSESDRTTKAMKENRPETEDHPRTLKRQLTVQSKKTVVENSQETKDHPRSLMRQMVCAFLINSVAFLQGASVSTSSIILHELQGNSSDLHQDLGIFKDFHITEEEGSWIGTM